jgi:hypothetical protein
MVRTVISLDNEDKSWLDKQSRARGVTMTRLVREAVRFYRDRAELRNTSLQQLLNATKGIWKKGDGLKYQRRVRAEWETKR